jgi:hypothetical protein
VLVDDEGMVKALHEPLKDHLSLEVVRPAAPGKRERDLIEKALPGCKIVR